MADNGEPSEGDERSRRAAGRLGRRVAAVIYWMIAAYVVGVGVWSIVPQVFWPAGRTPAAGASCVDGLESLRGELLARAGDRIAAGGSEDDEGLHRWLSDWDARHAGLESRCEGSGHSAWSTLGSLRQRVESTLSRFDGEEGSLARELASALEGSR